MGLQLTAIATKASPNQNAALLALREALKPATVDEITDALVRMNERCKPPYGSDDDVRLAEYRRDLLAYPRDVALTALREWPDAHTDWPKWGEIKPILDALSAKRKRMLVAVQGLNLTKSENELFPPPTAADKADVRAMLDKFKTGLTTAPGKPKQLGFMQRQVEQRREAEIAAQEPTLEERREQFRQMTS